MAVWSRRAIGVIAALLWGAGGGIAHAGEPTRDWANLGAYREADRLLIANGEDVARVVFMGDSITEFWDKPRTGFFANPHFVNRGISGQTSAQMLVRFRQDVLALHPRLVVILAGTNDVAGNTGPATNEDIEGYIASMVELARANGVAVVLVSLVPTARYPWAPDADPIARIGQINGWLREYAQSSKIPFADVFTPMATPEKALRPDLGDDGVHPNAQGYAIIEGVLSPLLKGRATPEAPSR